MTERILRRPEVSERTGLKRSTLYAYLSDGRFPPQVKLGPRAVGWRESEVNAWIAQRIADRDTPPEQA